MACFVWAGQPWRKGGAKGEFSGQVEVESVDVGQTALNHDVKRSIQSKPAEDAMRGAAAKHLAATKDFLHLVIRNLHSIDGLLAVELILKIDRRGAGSPVRCAEKSALGQVTPSFRQEIIKKQPVSCFVKSRDVSSIGRPARSDQSSGLRQDRPLTGA